ncbi:MAG: uracil-DNA glycosylase [Muribaculaceae bacterium]|nr:uracil-DNA glycosylase [Muribaculaceae bacterium]
MNVKIESGWQRALASEWESPYFDTLTRYVRQRYAETTVYPAPSRIFAAFDACPFDKVKVVILGQDPYHGPGQANGLCFSVNPGVAIPPSLVNIYKEMSTDIGLPPHTDGDLSYLAEQGVLLLNATLTVEAHSPGSHQGHGWEQLTDAAIRALNDGREGIVFLLWGSYAIRKGAFIDRSRHLVLEAPHPSPLSAYRGFFGCRHFSKANDYLRAHGIEPVKWL